MALRQPRAPGTRSQTPANATQQPDAVPWKNQQPEAFPGNPGTVSNAPPTTFPGPEVFGKPETGNRGPTTEGGLPSKVVTSSGSALRRCSCFADSEKDPAKLVSSQTWPLANAPEPPECAGSRQIKAFVRRRPLGHSGSARRLLECPVLPRDLSETRACGQKHSRRLGEFPETLRHSEVARRPPGDSVVQTIPKDLLETREHPETLRDSSFARRLSETRVCGLPRKTPGDSGAS